ncbi:MAG TPA: UDP-N-acetylmuramoyl-L-alanine--D-glutamate ligase [Candidatus Binatia bacterium]|nr:UDP-N-acetylmuramoyl-L-alanine--D-glutamate ligase [Candidatus Binatia bacterium]
MASTEGDGARAGAPGSRPGRRTPQHAGADRARARPVPAHSTVPGTLAGLAGQRVALWGFGREGRAALAELRALEPAPARLTIVTDSPPGAAAEAPPDLEWVHGEAGLPRLLDADTVIRSPGISRYREDAQRVAASTRVTTGTNLWFAEHREDPVVAVTGSKGKSTTSSLVAHLAGAAGRRAVLAGNIGIPLLSVLHPVAVPDLWVLELSSHQIADLEWSPRIGVLLNLYREHLDWHGSLERYIADKLNLFAHRADGIAVLNREDAVTRERARRLPGRRVWFADAAGYRTDGEALWWGGERLIGADRLPLRGRHNLLNACAALCAVELAGVDARAQVPALTGFRPLPHRLERVTELDGVSYVNDSIATIPEAAVAALDAMGGRPTVLIAGGFDRGQDYGGLVDRVCAAADVLAVVTVPPSGERLAEQLRSHAFSPPVLPAGNLEQAVALARDQSRPGSVVLLSPAAPSYGVFRDFEERGEAFRRLVGRLSAAGNRGTG